MKKILFKALPFTIVVVITMGSACKQKEDEVPLPSISITDSVDADFESVTLHCSVSGNVSAEQLIVEYSKDQSLSGASKKSADKSGNGFTITIDGLEVQTTYFYRYTVENKISSLSDKNVRQFKTRDFSAPQVTTVGVTDLSGQSATLVGRIEYACGKPIIEQGFYFGRSKDALTFMLSAPESFSYTIDTLAFETRYYFQAYAKNEIGVGKGDIVEFTTLTGIPELETSSVSNISIHTATLNGELKHDGGCPVIELGFCYSESEAPSVSSSKITVEGAIGQFSQDISDLKPATKYYVRTYCINSKGTHYGNEVSFVTNPIEVTSIKLNKTSLLLLKGLSETLIATVEPDDASDKTIHWSSSDESIATVDDKGLVYAANKGSAYIYAKAGEKIDSCAVTVEKVYFKPEVVDLGLSVKWASFNLGAVKPSDPGDLYAWGETESKNTFTWENYKFGNSPETMTKYGVEGLNSLQPEDDAAIQHLGGYWRMPTSNELIELASNCSWVWTEEDGKKGYLVKSKMNQNSIFLPITNGSLGYYRSSDRVWNSTSTYCLAFNSGSVARSYKISAAEGYAIRPVSIEPNVVESVSLSPVSLSLIEGEQFQMHYAIQPTNMTNKDVSWSSSKPSIASVDANGIISAIQPGTTIITVTTTDGGKTDQCSVIVEKSPIANPTGTAVDLGLSVKWASCNLGANSPEEYGDYFAYGEILPKTEYSWSSYKWGNNKDELTKYNNTDHKSKLELSDDAAHILWGNNWRIPSSEELRELLNNCTWTWTLRGTIRGYEVTSNTNGNSIFLPAAGYMDGKSVINTNSIGYYSSFNLDTYPYYYLFNYLEIKSIMDSYGHMTDRYYGLSIRPVAE